MTDDVPYSDDELGVMRAGCLQSPMWRALNPHLVRTVATIDRLQAELAAAIADCAARRAAERHWAEQREALQAELAEAFTQARERGCELAQANEDIRVIRADAGKASEWLCAQLAERDRELAEAKAEVAALQAASDEYLRADLAGHAEAEALRALIASLPKCTAWTGLTAPRCGDPATKAWKRGSERYCDTHGTNTIGATAPDYPRAGPLRAALALLAKRGQR